MYGTIISGQKTKTKFLLPDAIDQFCTRIDDADGPPPAPLRMYSPPRQKIHKAWLVPKSTQSQDHVSRSMQNTGNTDNMNSIGTPLRQRCEHCDQQNHISKYCPTLLQFAGGDCGSKQYDRAKTDMDITVKQPPENRTWLSRRENPATNNVTSNAKSHVGAVGGPSTSCSSQLQYVQQHVATPNVPQHAPRQYEYSTKLVESTDSTDVHELSNNPDVHMEIMNGLAQLKVQNVKTIPSSAKYKSEQNMKVPSLDTIERRKPDDLLQCSVDSSVSRTSRIGYKTTSPRELHLTEPTRLTQLQQSMDSTNICISDTSWKPTSPKPLQLMKPTRTTLRQESMDSTKTRTSHTSWNTASPTVALTKNEIRCEEQYQKSCVKQPRESQFVNYPKKGLSTGAGRGKWF